MKIAATTTAFPPYYFTQNEVLTALKTYWDKGLENAAVLERLHSRTGVDGRYFCRPLEQYYALDTWGKTNDVWIETAETLGEQAIRTLLRETGLPPEKIGTIIFVSVTGIACPSIEITGMTRVVAPVTKASRARFASSRLNFRSSNASPSVAIKSISVVRVTPRKISWSA